MFSQPLLAGILTVSELLPSLPILVGMVMAPIRCLDSDARRCRYNSRCLDHHLGVNRHPRRSDR
jgi:hypothetical protein